MRAIHVAAKKKFERKSVQTKAACIKFIVYVYSTLYRWCNEHPKATMNEISIEIHSHANTNGAHTHTYTPCLTGYCELNDIENDGYQVYTKYWYQDIYHCRREQCELMHMNSSNTCNWAAVVCAPNCECTIPQCELNGITGRLFKTTHKTKPLTRPRCRFQDCFDRTTNDTHPLEMSNTSHIAAPTSSQRICGMKFCTA